jgi:hypothetical protein
MGHRLILAIAIGVLLGKACPIMAAASPDLPPGSIKVSEQVLGELHGSPALRTELERLETLPSQDLAAAAGALCQAEPPLVANATLALWLDQRVVQEQLNPAQQAALDVLASCPERVWYRHPESASDWWLPAFSIAKRALAIQGLHQRKQLGRTAAIILTKHGSEAWEPQWDAQIAALAVAALEPAQLRDLARKPEALPEVLLLPLAVHSGDERLRIEALRRCPDAELLPALATIFAELAPENRMSSLELLSRRPALASAAVLASRVWPESKDHDAWLVAQLADLQIGSSVAQLLAQRWPVSRIVSQSREKSSTERARGHLALALRLKASEEAEQALRDLAVSGLLPAEMGAELLR